MNQSRSSILIESHKCRREKVYLNSKQHAFIENRVNLQEKIMDLKS